MIKYKFKKEENAIAAQKEIIEKGWDDITEVRWDCIYTLKDLDSDEISDLEEVIKKHGGEATLVVGVL